MMTKVKLDIYGRFYQPKSNSIFCADTMRHIKMLSFDIIFNRKKTPYALMRKNMNDDKIGKFLRYTLNNVTRC